MPLVTIMSRPFRACFLRANPTPGFRPGLVCDALPGLFSPFRRFPRIFGWTHSHRDRRRKKRTSCNSLDGPRHPSAESARHASPGRNPGSWMPLVTIMSRPFRACFLRPNPTPGFRPGLVCDALPGLFFPFCRFARIFEWTHSRRDRRRKKRHPGTAWMALVIVMSRPCRAFFLRRNPGAWMPLATPALKAPDMQAQGGTLGPGCPSLPQR